MYKFTRKKKLGLMKYTGIGEFIINYTDLKNLDCEEGQYKCQRNGYCLDSILICDGIRHCTFGDDEQDCSMDKL